MLSQEDAKYFFFSVDLKFKPERITCFYPNRSSEWRKVFRVAFVLLLFLCDVCRCAYSLARCSLVLIRCVWLFHAHRRLRLLCSRMFMHFFMLSLAKFFVTKWNYEYMVQKIVYHSAWINNKIDLFASILG